MVNHTTQRSNFAQLVLAMELHNLHTYHTQGEILDPHTMISYDFPTHVIRDMIPISDLMFRLVE